jgi:hypothetical protein
MVPFLQKTAQYLVTTYKDNLSELCIVLPNRRAGLFLRKYLAAEVGKVTWAPTVFSIEDFIAELSGYQEVENLHLLFELYGVHIEIQGKNAEPFEEFLRWAPQLLTDFNEIDRYLADAKELFSTLTEARAIALWNVDGQPLTEFEKKYLQFYQSLHGYYEKLTQRLSDRNKAYQGLSFRAAAENVESKMDQLPWHHIIFAGFNALTKAEEHIIGVLRNNGKATLLWDSDRYYLENRQQEAGDFLREWIRKWPLEEPLWIDDDFATTGKQIEIVGSPDPVGQVKYCGQLLQELASQGRADEKTAVVLLDEGLLIPLLNSMPEEVSALNITAGLPLNQTPLAGLFDLVFQLHLHTSQFTYLVSKDINKYYYKDVLKLLQHPYIRRMVQSLSHGNRFVLDETTERIRLGHKIFIGMDEIVSLKSGLFSETLSFLEPVFIHWADPADVLACFKAMIESLRSSDGAEQHDRALRADLLAATTQFHDEHHKRRVGHDATELRERHPIAVEAGAFQRIIRHHAGQRAVGDVDGGIEQHQEIIGDPGPHELAGRAEIERGEGEDEDDGQRQAQPDQIGPEPAPAGLRAVRHGTDEKVHHAIRAAGKHQHRACSRRGDAEDVGVIKHDEIHHQRPDEVAGGVAEAITDFFLKGEFHERELRSWW